MHLGGSPVAPWCLPSDRTEHWMLIQLDLNATRPGNAARPECYQLARPERYQMATIKVQSLPSVHCCVFVVF